MAVKTLFIQLSTRGNTDMIDITAQVANTVAESEIENGLVTVFCPSSTSGLTTIEFELGALNDLRRLYDEMIDPNRHYDHNARWGDGNGHAHVRSALVGPSLSVPVASRLLTLGTWQQIIFIDFDNRPRQRRLIVQVIGE